jgi:hypothetical protein
VDVIAARFGSASTPSSGRSSRATARAATSWFLLSFTPASTFELVSGEDQLTEYRFHREVIQHQFCRACGVEAFARGKMLDRTNLVAVNVRCIDDIDRSKLTVSQVDGRSR